MIRGARIAKTISHFWNTQTLTQKKKCIRHLLLITPCFVRFWVSFSWASHSAICRLAFSSFFISRGWLLLMAGAVFSTIEQVPLWRLHILTIILRAHSASKSLSGQVIYFCQPLSWWLCVWSYWTSRPIYLRVCGIARNDFPLYDTWCIVYITPHSWMVDHYRPSWF